jgi:uncharacterized protein DUF2188
MRSILIGSQIRVRLGKGEIRTMANNSEVFVKKHPNGWAVTKPNADRASGIFETQAEAIRRAHEIAGKGTVHIQGRHGKFRTETPFDK